MKKLFSLGIIVAASPLSLVIACGSDNPSHSDNSKDVNTDKNQYKPLAVGVKLMDLSDEDLWVFSSIFFRGDKFNMNPGEWKEGIKKYRGRVSSRMTQSHDIVYPHVTQEEYNKILKKGKDILEGKYLIEPYFKKTGKYGFNEPLKRKKISWMKKYYSYYKNSSIKNLINPKFENWYDGKTHIAKWL